MHINGTLVEENKRQQRQLKDFRNFLDRVFIFRIPFDPKLIVQTNLHEDDAWVEDLVMYEQDDFKDENTIDDYEAYERMLKKFPGLRRTNTRFKLTDKPSALDFTKYNLSFKMWCKDSKALIKAVRKDLRINLVDCNNDDIFECLEECIIRAVQKYAIIDEFEKIPNGEKP